jgi:hypothetical protein
MKIGNEFEKLSDASNFYDRPVSGPAASPKIHDKLMIGDQKECDL